MDTDNHSPIPAHRVLLRLFSFFLCLLFLDLGARQYWGPQIQQNYDQAYRLPEDLETPFLNNYLRHIRQSPHKKLVFLGSSPSYGVNISDPELTYPEVLEAELQAQGLSAEVYNLAAKGYLMSDVHFLLKALVGHVDMVFLQINYHTFSPQLLSGTAIRHPELPEQLGVEVSLSEAKALGLRPSPRLNLNQPIRSRLQAAWFLYGQRAELAHLWLKDTPEAWFYHLFYAKASEEHSFKPFYELKPAQQTFMVKRYAENVNFEIQSENLELRFLQQSLTLLQRYQIPFVVVMAPINVDGLSFYELFNRQQYAQNSSIIRQQVEDSGGQYIDVNLSEPLPEDYFADISHTLNEGGEAFGGILYAQTQKLLEQSLR